MSGRRGDLVSLAHFQSICALAFLLTLSVTAQLVQKMNPCTPRLQTGIQAPWYPGASLGAFSVKDFRFVVSTRFNTYLYLGEFMNGSLVDAVIL